mmetsp:Transcript_19913/g.40486  ORF Transcript_19913/g.40486 Transcript_19913/m.40486 type:complete len:204 (+) Transcript_19913:1549-2160(+)
MMPIVLMQVATVVAILFLFATVAATEEDDRLLAACMSSSDQSYEDVAVSLKAGADINARDERSGQTCLMAATLRGKPTVVKYLIEKGADTTIPERDGYTPPHGAGFQGRPDVMKILKDDGNVDVINAPHPDGFAPIHRACWGSQPRHTEVVEYLIQIGEDPNRRSVGDRKQTCWEMTRNSHTKEVLERYGVKGSSEGHRSDEM